MKLSYDKILNEEPLSKDLLSEYANITGEVLLKYTDIINVYVPICLHTFILSCV